MKNKNKVSIIIAICLFILIIVLTILFQVIIPNLDNENASENENFVADNTTITEDNIYKPSENEWITLQLSR